MTGRAREFTLGALTENEDDSESDARASACVASIERVRMHDERADEYHTAFDAERCQRKRLAVARGFGDSRCDEHKRVE